MAWYGTYFNANGGTLNSPGTLYYNSDGKYWHTTGNAQGTTISFVTAPSRAGYAFTGFYNGSTQVIGPDGMLPASGGLAYMTVYAGWTPVAVDSPPALSGGGGFSAPVDFFGLASPSLVPISSDAGNDTRRECVSNATWSGSTQTGGAGRYSAGVSDSGGVWRNPTVTYMVVGDMTLSLNLGTAFAAVFAPNGAMAQSGYMIVSARVRTAARQFPTVTVSAVANEGADAINLFAVSIPIVARAKAQNLLGAVSGGGELQACELVAECQPVVLAENNMPCASDVVHGRYAVAATTHAYANEDAPVAAGGFAVVGQPMSSAAGQYLAWNLNAQMEIN